MSDERDTGDTPVVRKSIGRCPICRRPTVLATRPFCSARCADLDLARWLGGRYAIAGSIDAEEDETLSGEAITRGPQSTAMPDDEA